MERRPATAPVRTARTIDDVAAGQQLPALEVDVTPTTVVLGAMGARDWAPPHHDLAWATERLGLPHLFLGTPTQAAWLERYVTDWTGPRGRIGAMRTRMRTSVFAGRAMTLAGTVEAVEVDEVGCGWVEVAVELTSGGEQCTSSRLRVALPRQDGDNPWSRHGPAWRPTPPGRPG